MPLALIRFCLFCVAVACGVLAAGPRAAEAADAIAVTAGTPAINLGRAVSFVQGEGDRVSVPTAPGSDGIVRRMEVRHTQTGSSPVWAVFTLSNATDEQVDRLVVVPHYRLIRSGLVRPDLGSQRIVALTPSQGFRPERQSAVDQDVFQITLDPGTTVTFVAELRDPRIPQITLWQPDAFKDRENSFTLYRGIILGIAGLLALFLTILFVVKGSLMFPAAALLAWAVLGTLGLDFGFWTRIMELPPEAVAFWRAVSEAILSATLMIFLFAYLDLNRWHVRYTVLTAVWLAFAGGMVTLAWFDPPIAAGIARLGIGAVTILGTVILVYLAFLRYDRAINLVPTWTLFMIWSGAALLMVTGRLNNEIAAPALLGALVLLVMLIGFTVMQHAFAGGGMPKGLVSDTERKALALTGAGDIIFDWDVGSNRVVVGHELETHLGLKRGALEGQANRFIDALHPGDRDRLRSTFDTVVEHRRGRLVEEFRMRVADGHFVWIVLRARPVVGSDGEVIRLVGTLTDITEFKTSEERLLHDAVHDNLTGLPNRELFLDRLEAALNQAQADDGRRPTVLVLDIDRFKQVNDSVGLSVGDSILLTVSRRLGRLLKPQDTLARFNGDQFGIILISERAAERITAFAETIRKTLRAPLAFGDREIFLTGSLGIALADGTQRKREDLLKDAELAAYHAKRLGGDRIEVFKPALRAHKSDRLALESDLRRALERGEIALVYQPVVRLADRTLAGFEALVRWDHPRLGRLPPGEFIAIAEETGLIVDLGLFVMDRAARQLANWQALMPLDPPLFTAVNVSSRQLLRHDLLQDIKGVLARAPVAKGSFKIELTESLVMENPEYAAQMLQRIRDLGAGLSLDDFGTGYSSLAYLQRFPFDTIKIDKSFVRADSRGSRSVLLRSIIALGHDLGMEVVAEGAETDADAVELYQFGADFAQGFAFGEPMTADQATKLLKAAVAQAA
ncbi:MAG: EAL domain-containing protein [Phreatobacter sp.]|uniref:EAL domain-containing protein n=1 Tax=Phreatobacter sp. TaxID=1966341 RepID=UPI001A618455|nr:EAL domain-containing protein [Phreatobacter sp.]MBL8567727.1 EAL domain-containing protein [Phreatobacter sp.]